MLRTVLSKISLRSYVPELFVQLESLFPYPQKLALALSGGSDSMLMAVLMLEFWQEKGWHQDLLFFLHCNHKLRKESDDEQKTLQERFEGRNFVFFVRSQDWNVSEEALRERRYEQFRRFMQQEEIEVLLTGHNLSDRVEGTLLNLLRGCGLQGLLGMRVEEQHHLLDEKKVIRPLVFLSKERIKNLADDLGIPYFIDKSNQDTSISRRNLIRNQFLTPLSELSLGEGEERSFWSSRSTVYGEIEEKMDWWTLFLEPIRLCPYRWASQAFEWKLPRGILSKEMIAECCAALGIFVTWGEIWEILHWLSNSQEGGRQLWWWWLFIAHERRYFIKSDKRFWQKELCLEKEITEVWIQTFGLFQLEVNKELIGARLRFPRSEDSFRWKTLKKWMLNQKIPIFWRNALPLAEKDGKVIVVWKPEMLMF